MPQATRRHADQAPPVQQAPAQDQLQDPLAQNAAQDDLYPTPAESAQQLTPHLAERAKQQALLNTDKHGQGMAEELARKGGPGGSNLFAQGTAPLAMSQALRDLVALTKYDSLKKKDVLLRSGEGSLTEAEKWTLAEVNNKMMQYIQPGMTINKIIPDGTVRSIVENGYMSDFGGPNNKVGGSVAHKMNYDQGLTGAESVANFGLDYASYTDVDYKNNPVEVKQGKALESGLKPTFKKGPVPENLWHSPYTRENDQGQLTPVENVFYVQFELPENRLDNVTVPIHPELITWAKKNLMLLKGIGKLDAELASRFPAAAAQELRAEAARKRSILESFLAKVTKNGPQVTRKLQGQGSNPQDPLTNLGMTRKGSRLTTEFGTINQEYYLSEYFELPQGSGLWLKDASGVDQQVGTLSTNDEGELRWGELNQALMDQRLRVNTPPDQ